MILAVQTVTIGFSLAFQTLGILSHTATSWLLWTLSSAIPRTIKGQLVTSALLGILEVRKKFKFPGIAKFLQDTKPFSVKLELVELWHFSGIQRTFLEVFLTSGLPPYVQRMYLIAHSDVTSRTSAGVAM